MARGLIKTLGLAGAALTAWYFLDPKKGSGRRDNLVKSAKDLYGTASDELGRLGKDLSTGLTDTMHKVSEMTGMGGSSASGSSASGSVGSGSSSAASGTQGSSRSSAQDSATRQSESFSAPVSA